MIIKTKHTDNIEGKIVSRPSGTNPYFLMEVENAQGHEIVQDTSVFLAQYDLIQEEMEIQAPVEIPEMGLFEVTQKQISTDGVETAVCKYSTTEPVTFYVDDGEITPIEVEPVDYWAVLEITSESKGKIIIEVEDQQKIIYAI